MFKYHCLNPISQVGLDRFDEKYEKTVGHRGGRCGSGAERQYEGDGSFRRI